MSSPTNGSTSGLSEALGFGEPASLDALGIGATSGIGGIGSGEGGSSSGGTDGVGDAASAGVGGGGFRKGGEVDGPGGPRSDSIVARLSDGEYVIRADVVEKLGVPFFDAINSMFASGGR
jgi:hypothetical protein